MLRIYVDEVKAKGFALICVAIHDRDVLLTRRRLRNFVLPGQRRLHFRRESDSRRREFLSALSELQFTTMVISSDEKSTKTARSDCNRQLAELAIKLDAVELIFETDHTSVEDDRRQVQEYARKFERGIGCTHREPHAEPILWIADAIGWATQRGGEWTKRLNPFEIKRVHTK